MLRTCLVLSGIGQLMLVVGSLSIPAVLGWREQLRANRPLIRQVFWTYAAYILGSHLFFGLVSTLHPDALLNHSPLATALTAFITLWWGGRLVIQFAYFDRTDAPPGPVSHIGERLLVTLFTGLFMVYALSLLHNLQ